MRSSGSSASASSGGFHVKRCQFPGVSRETLPRSRDEWIRRTIGRSMTKAESYDVIVVGGGHAGCEAAAAAARLGARTALVTHRFATVGAMSCNPAIGGLGKGHLVREIDALDGLMGAGGRPRRHPVPGAQPPQGPGGARPARAGRPQALRRGDAGGDPGPDQSDGHRGRGRRPGRGGRPGRRRRSPPTAACCSAGAVVLTTGTFLRGLIHIGETQIPAGRVGEAPALGLSRTLARLGLTLGPAQDRHAAAARRPHHRLGEPGDAGGRRAARAVLDPDRAAAQAAGRVRHHPHHRGDPRGIRANLARSPMYSGQIESRGPRYCPSIEDKVVRFGDRDGHQIFLEPEGLDDHTVYPNGISTSLPEDVQRAVVALDPGPGARRHPAAGLRHRIRPYRPARAGADAGDQAGAPGCSWPARSTAPPATRRRRRRG